MDTLFRIKTFISYWLNAVDKHSLHSPFLFDLYTKVIRSNPLDDDHQPIEKLRKKLLHDHREILVEDFGGGSSVLKNASRKISAISKTSLSDPKYSALYNRMIKYSGAKNIVELGTSFGINTMYLSQVENTKVTTFEGSSEIAGIAELTFDFLNRKNINLIKGNIDKTLSAFIQDSGKIDFIFIDANHRYQPTLKYFELLLPKIHHRSVLAIDDIYYSEEMARAWRHIKNHDLVYTSIDLYKCGLLFFDPSLNKQHVVLQF